MLVNRCMTLMLHGWGLKYVNYSSPAAVWVEPFQLRLIFCQAVQPCCRQTSPAQGAVEWKEPHPFLHRRGSIVAVYPRCASAVQQGKKKARLCLLDTLTHTSTQNGTSLHAHNSTCFQTCGCISMLKRWGYLNNTFFIWGVSPFFFYQGINTSKMTGKDFILRFS